MRIRALEAGGTKMVCAVGDETGAVVVGSGERDRGAGQRLLWTGGSAGWLEKLWLYHDHAKARLGLVRYGGNVPPGAGRQRGI